MWRLGVTLAAERKRFEALDGLRGVAAFCVFLFHIAPRRAELSWLEPRGYLAVDFFFVLSGFVVAKAYGPRLQSSLSFRDFLLIRVKRLWPMIILSTAVAFAVLGWRNLGHPDAITELAIESAAVFFLIPILTKQTTEVAYTFQSTFPTNPPAWSLCLEMVANVLYGLLGKHLRPWLIYLIAVVAFLFFAPLEILNQPGMVGPTKASFFFGFTRVLFGFFAGVAVAQAPRPKRATGAMFWIIAAGMVLVAMIPTHFGGSWLDLGLILTMPWVVWIGSGIEWKSAAAELAGRASYPLYLLHYPLFAILPRGHNPLAGVIFMAVVLALSVVVSEFVEKPVLKRLNYRRVAPASTAP